MRQVGALLGRLAADRGMLDVVGFSADAPSVMAGFSRGEI